MAIERKLGKQAPRIDTRTLQFRDYLKREALPAPPPFASYVTKVGDWPMYLNDRLGDCVAAAAGHVIEQQTLFAQKPALPTDADVLTFYESQGYTPSDPSTDNGMVILPALNYWRKVGLGGHKIQSFVQINPANIDEVKSAIYLFGSVMIGLALPISAQAQTDAWTVADGGPYFDGSPGSWGGHCVPVVAYSDKSFTIVTWGQTMKMSYNFFKDYCDEAYAVLSYDWINSMSGNAYNGFNFSQLAADLAQM